MGLAQLTGWGTADMLRLMRRLVLAVLGLGFTACIASGPAPSTVRPTDPNAAIVKLPPGSTGAVATAKVERGPNPGEARPAASQNPANLVEAYDCSLPHDDVVVDAPPLSVGQTDLLQGSWGIDERSAKGDVTLGEDALAYVPF